METNYRESNIRKLLLLLKTATRSELEKALFAEINAFNEIREEVDRTNEILEESDYEDSFMARVNYKEACENCNMSVATMTFLEKVLDSRGAEDERNVRDLSATRGAVEYALSLLD